MPIDYRPSATYGRIVVRVLRGLENVLEDDDELVGANWEALDDIGKAVMDRAKASVAPGRGPKPHLSSKDHPWEDTGNLQEAINYEVHRSRGQWTMNVGVLRDSVVGRYGTALELGWNSVERDGSANWNQYPWLLPALEWQAKTYRNDVARRYIQVFKARRKVNKPGLIYVGPEGLMNSIKNIRGFTY